MRKGQYVSGRGNGKVADHRSSIVATSTKVQRASAGKASTNGKATSKASKPAATQTSQTLTVAMLKLGKVIWGAWVKGKLYVNLGIREKTATKTGTRAAMLAVAAYGYKQGEGKILAMAVRAAQGNDPNVGGIDFPWLEKQANMATITSSAAIRLDAKDQKMRLLPITASKAQRAERAKSKLATATRDPERSNGEVRVIKPAKPRKGKLSKAQVAEREQSATGRASDAEQRLVESIAQSDAN